MKVSHIYVISNGLRDLVEAALESAHTTHEDMILGCCALVHVVDGGVPAENMTIADPVHLVAGVTAVVFVPVKPQDKSALGIVILHIFGGKGNGEKSSKESASVVSGIGATGMRHEWGSCKPLHDRLSPFHHHALDFVLPQKSKDLLRVIVGSVRGGRTRLDSNPENDRTETPLLFLSRRTVCEKAGRVNGGPLDLPCLDDVANLKTDNVPDLVQQSIEDSTE